MSAVKRESLRQILDRTADVLFPAGAPGEISASSRDCDGDTPLHIVAFWGERHAIEQLVEAGAEVDAEGDMGYTPLDCAVMGGHVPAAEALLELGADPDHRNEFGSSTREKVLRGSDKKMAKLFRGWCRAAVRPPKP